MTKDLRPMDGACLPGNNRLSSFVYLYLFMLDRWAATATSYSILLTPVGTVIIAAWLTDEVVTPYFLLGGVMVLLGVWVGAIAQPK